MSANVMEISDRALYVGTMEKIIETIAIGITLLLTLQATCFAEGEKFAVPVLQERLADAGFIPTDYHRP